MKTIEEYKRDFKAEFRTFIKDLKTAISCDNGQWSIKGFIDVYKNVYTISSDTKIVSKILEIHLFPLILKFAERIGYKIVLAEKQNYYPDLTFINKTNEDIKFAVDLKTTFRRNGDVGGFTLGSHGAYFEKRDGKKNIQFPYNQYKGHYCLGVVYTQEEANEENTPDLSETQIIKVSELGESSIKDNCSRDTSVKDTLMSITSVIKDFDFFFSEKWKIASDSQGSGNTANIGSISGLDAIKNEEGVFSKLGEEYFDLYWLGYNKIPVQINGKYKNVTSIWEFLVSRNEESKFDLVGKGAKRKLTLQENKQQDNSATLFEDDNPSN